MGRRFTFGVELPQLLFLVVQRSIISRLPSRLGFKAGWFEIGQRAGLRWLWFLYNRLYLVDGPAVSENATIKQGRYHLAVIQPAQQGAQQTRIVQVKQLELLVILVCYYGLSCGKGTLQIFVPGFLNRLGDTHAHYQPGLVFYGGHDDDITGWDRLPLVCLKGDIGSLLKIVEGQSKLVGVLIGALDI